jgi:hypothetical protein
MQFFAPLCERHSAFAPGSKNENGWRFHHFLKPGASDVLLNCGASHPLVENIEALI